MWENTEDVKNSAHISYESAKGMSPPSSAMNSTLRGSLPMAADAELPDPTTSHTFHPSSITNIFACRPPSGAESASPSSGSSSSPALNE